MSEPTLEEDLLFMAKAVEEHFKDRGRVVVLVAGDDTFSCAARLRSAAARLRSEMAAFEKRSNDKLDPMRDYAFVVVNALTRINGGPLDTRSEPGRGGGSAGSIPCLPLPAEETKRIDRADVRRAIVVGEHARWLANNPTIASAHPFETCSLCRDNR